MDGLRIFSYRGGSNSSSTRLRNLFNSSFKGDWVRLIKNNMVYNDNSGGQGIVQDTYFEASANSVSYPIADVTRNSNTALDNVVTLILGADGKWQFDDTNATDLPIGTTALVSGQQDYSFDAEYLVIKSIECSDSAGKWTKLIPIDNYDEPIALSEFLTTNAIPKYYDKMGEAILLYPAPNYSIAPTDTPAGGLRAYFQRKMDYFVVGDTTKEPGFANHLHKYIPLYNAYVYACAKELPKQASLEKRLRFYVGNKLEGGNDGGAITKFYSYREQDTIKEITSETVNPY